MTECFHYTQGKEFQIGSLQAVVAVAHGGETLHHIAGLNPFMSRGEQQEKAVQSDAMSRLSWLRWLFIDEAMMNSAAFLGEIEQCLRWKIPDSSFFKRSPDGAARAFGGINLMHFGDTRQIPPPEGIPLFAIPAEFVSLPKSMSPSPVASHGLRLLWGLTPGHF